jgi:8-oxo-dGTP pyrophosphatase MutT (NUDIX family)
LKHADALQSPKLFSPEAVEALARDALYGEVRLAPEDPAHSDHAIAGMNPDPALLAQARAAAVLVPLVAHPDGVTVLLTQRAAAMRAHSGQIAFPGGKIDPEDDGPLAAALREAEEEIGLERRHVTPLGFLGPYFSTSGFRITPVVGLVRPDAALSINPQEVDRVFETPLAFLMDEANHQTHEREWKGAMRRYFAMPFGEHYIWGVTAGIIRMLWLRLYAPRGP